MREADPCATGSFLHHLRMRKPAARGTWVQAISFPCEYQGLCARSPIKQAAHERRERKQKKKANRLIWITSTVTPFSFYEHSSAGVCNALANPSSVEAGIRQTIFPKVTLLFPGSSGWLSSYTFPYLPTTCRARMTSRSNEFSSLSSSSLSSWQASCNQTRGSSVVTSSEHYGCSSPGGPASRNFSTSSLGGYTSSSCPSVFSNEKLWTPLHLDMDPTFQQRRKQEKEEMKILNDQFASLIGKVRGAPGSSDHRGQWGMGCECLWQERFARVAIPWC